MTEALERAFKAAQQLPERDQREIAELIEQKLSDIRWDERPAGPESDKLLRQLTAEAIEEDDAGDLVMIGIGVGLALSGRRD